MPYLQGEKRQRMILLFYYLFTDPFTREENLKVDVATCKGMLFSSLDISKVSYV